LVCICAAEVLGIDICDAPVSVSFHEYVVEVDGGAKITAAAT
jgi:hypothetical protein